MNRLSQIMLVLCVAVLAVSSAHSEAHANSPSVLIPVQGMLTDAQNQPLNGEVEVTFSLYATAFGNEAIWSETQDLTITQGLFTTYLGTYDTIDAELFVEHRAPYVAIQVENDAEMERWALGHSPFAAFAERADDARTLQGMTPEDFNQDLTLEAEAVEFDDASAGLGASNTQDAIEALLARIEALETQVADGGSEIADLSATVASVSNSQENIDGRLDQAESDIASNSYMISTLESTVGTFDGRITQNESDIATNASSISSLQSSVSSLNSLVNSMQSTVNSLESTVSSLQSTVDGFDGRITSLETKTAPISRSTVQGHDSLVFTNVNVHVRSGSGSTFGAVNGRGNLIVGYNEGTGDKTGSHNIVYGRNNSYTSFGGLVGGQNNSITGQYSAVVTGTNNTAEGSQSSVLGGSYGTASGTSSSVSGGWQNTASGSWSAVGGGGYTEEGRMDGWSAGNLSTN